MTEAPQFAVREVDLYQRPVVLRLPFRFGVVTLTECPQAFARVRIESGQAVITGRNQDISTDGNTDLVAMDDFISGEPHPIR